MRRLQLTFVFGPFLFLASLAAQETGKETRSVIEITPQTAKPSVASIFPIDEANAFFLNKRGQVGVAKFSPGLSLIGWEYYSEIKWNALPSLAQGPNYSIILSSPDEVTQAFDTDKDVELDFFQSLIADWQGRETGSQITAGPVAGPHGRLLFATSPPSPVGGAEGEEQVVEKSRIVAWHPEAEELVTITESSLPIAAFAVDRRGLLAARLVMPEYKGGFFVSLTQLPSLNPEAPATIPEPMPFTLPSLVIPAELTKNQSPTGLAFFNESGEEKLAVVCPASKQVVEIVPTEVDGVWGGSILLRQVVEAPIETLVEMKAGELLAGGAEGFVPLNGVNEKFRITGIEIIPGGIELNLNDEVDRFQAVKPENYLVQAVSLKGGERDLSVVPTVVSDGRTVILKTGTLPDETVIRIICHRLPSASGEPLLSNAVFYTIHRKPKFEAEK
ncbi:MAG: hypothetical protein P1U58_12060 [Verrucomicrobiales bacterium]|nr:hypothetical protein [Verrucomicrobiales bacterium]